MNTNVSEAKQQLAATRFLGKPSQLRFKLTGNLGGGSVKDSAAVLR